MNPNMNVREVKECLDELSNFLNLSYFLTYEGLDYYDFFEKARKSLDRLYETFSKAILSLDHGSDSDQA